tara:strand:+ start:857 stop:1789 length:933 start_codon:yes stop_codon:yes gene_type:complete
MNELNFDELFKMMEKNKNKNKSNSNSNNDNNNEIKEAFVKNFDMKVGLNQTYGPPTVEDYKVVQYVTYVYYTMYPFKEGDVYPAAWKDGVVGNYQEIRAERAKAHKTKLKHGMKGLRLQIVVGVLLYHMLIQQQENLMPVPLFVKYLNAAMKRYSTKADQRSIDLQLFERYRTESKIKGIGIKPYLKKAFPSSYIDIQPENMIQFVAFSLFSLKRPEVFRARRIAEYSKLEFIDTTPPSNIAIAALYIVALQNDIKVNHTDFGVTEARLKQSLKTISQAGKNIPKLQTNLKNFILPATPVKKTKVSVSKK